MCFVPLPRMPRTHASTPFLGDDKCAVDEAFREIKSSSLLEIGGERLQDAFEQPLTDPALVATVTGLVRGYRSGRSAHCAPVRKILTIPFNTSRPLRQK
jgi:hypothetical protein